MQIIAQPCNMVQFKTEKFERTLSDHRFNDALKGAD